jgi:hypothetical protein
VSYLRPLTGCELLLIANDDSIPARLVEASDGRVVASYASARRLPAGATSALLIAGLAGERLAARARIAASDSTRAELLLQTGWWTVERRGQDRVTARLRSGVRPAGGEDECFGVTLDVSLGGMAIEVLDDPATDRIEVSTGFADDPPFIPCEVVRRRPLSGTTILHLRFAALDARQRGHVDDLVRQARDLPPVPDFAA